MRGGGEERRAREKRAMWLKLGLDILIWADLRGKVTCSSAHTGNRLMDRESGLQLRKHGCAACFCLFPRLVHVPALHLPGGLKIDPSRSTHHCYNPPLSLRSRHARGKQGHHCL